MAYLKISSDEMKNIFGNDEKKLEKGMELVREILILLSGLDTNKANKYLILAQQAVKNAANSAILDLNKLQYEYST